MKYLFPLILLLAGCNSGDTYQAEVNIPPREYTDFVNQSLKICQNPDEEQKFQVYAVTKGWPCKLENQTKANYGKCWKTHLETRCNNGKIVKSDTISGGEGTSFYKRGER